MPLSPESKPLDLLVVMNGSFVTEGKSVGGGDIVMLKFIALSNLQPDILLPASAASAKAFPRNHGQLLLTKKNKRPPSFWKLFVLFVFRIVQGAWLSWRNRRHVYDVALSSSPYSVDLIPVFCSKARHKGAVIFHILPKRKAVNLATRVRFAVAAI